MDHKGLAQQVNEAFQSGHDVLLDEIFAQEYLVHDPRGGMGLVVPLARLKRLVRFYHRLGRLQAEDLFQIEEGDRVANCYVFKLYPRVWWLRALSFGRAAISIPIVKHLPCSR